MIELEKYEVVEEIGRGGVAVVYRGRHRVLQNDVAVKVLHQEFAHNAEFVKRFINGARSAARLKHPNIITVFDVGDEKDCYFIVMELLHGEPLDERIKKHGPFSRQEIEDVIVPLTRALDYAHGSGIIHRDIKSSNIFLKEDGTPVLTDFDIAKATDLQQNLTLDGSVLGTPAYMSPEQARGETATSKSDIYSLGVVMYEMATGELPFKGENTLSVLQKIVLDTPRPPCEINPVVSAELQQIILHCMEKAPESRPVRADAIFEGDGEEAGGIEAPEPEAAEPASEEEAESESPPSGTPSLKKRRLLKIAIGVVILGVAYLGGLRLWRTLEMRDFDVVSLFTPGGDATGRIPLPPVPPARLDPIVVERVKKLFGEAVAMIKTGNIDGAVDELRTIENIDPGNRLAHRGLQKVYNWHLRNADATFKKGDYRGYRRFMDKALTYFPDMKLDNLYQRGKKFAGGGRLLGDGEDNAAAVYAAIIRTFPAETRASQRLDEVVDTALRKSFQDNTSRECTNRALALAAVLPEKASGIYGICGDMYYANNLLLSGNGYNAASMYTKALAADDTNDHARKQLLTIVAEIKNQLAGLNDRNEKRSLLRTARECFPDAGEFPSLLDELEAGSK